jgi:hypothetical protein
MRRKIVMTLTALTIAAMASVAVPTAANASGYGKQINDGCGASYGQLVSGARAIGHVTGSVSGAMNFVDSGLAAAHGCG